MMAVSELLVVVSTFILVGISQAEEVTVVQIGFQCPRNFPCTCENRTENGHQLNVVNCHSKGLTWIPDFTKINFRDSICIDLSNNSLKSVPRGKFKGLRIKWIMFDNNPMKMGINDLAFEEVDEVLALYCRNCSLPKVPNIFRYTDGLEILNLETNNISRIESGTFRDAQLKELYIGQNVFFPAGHMFVDLVDTLERLSLYRSFLFNVPVDAVNRLVNLKRLDLHYNMIPNIATSHMAQMPRNITYLNFGHNPISEIEYGAFEDFVNSRKGITINLIGSKITKVNFIEDVCRFNRAYMPLDDSPLVCDCSLYNITRDHAFNTSGFCDQPERFKWYSIYGDNSFVSNTYLNEGVDCPNVWKLPCKACTHPVIISSLLISLLVAMLLSKD